MFLIDFQTWKVFARGAMAFLDKRDESETAFDHVDRVFVGLANIEAEQGREEMREVDLVVLDVWHSFGIIEGDGLHGWLESEPAAAEVVERYRRLGLEEVTEALGKAAELYAGWLGGGGDKDGDAFRERFDEQLDGLENIVYENREKIPTLLSTLIEKDAETSGDN